METMILIPCRLNSSRLPNKVIADICGKSLITRVYEEAKKTVLEVRVIGGDPEIAQVLEAETEISSRTFIYVPDKTNNGTERCILGIKRKRLKANNFIIWQCDELIRYTHVLDLIKTCKKLNIGAGNITRPSYPEEQNDFNQVKVCMLNPHYVKYYHRLVGSTDHSQIGIYFFTKKCLDKLIPFQPTLELATRVEMNRVIVQDITVAAHIMPFDSDRLKVDTPDDLQKMREAFNICPDFPVK